MDALLEKKMKNTQRHLLLMLFAGLMFAHWLEHIVQAYQVYVMGFERHHALGLLGQIYPWLIHSEWLHFGFAVLTLAGLLLLLPAFSGAGRVWWNTALVVGIWHVFEHTLLFIQAQRGVFFFGAKEPTSVLQLVFPRIELHLFYNSVVAIPIVMAMLLYWRGGKDAVAPASNTPRTAYDGAS